MPLSLQFFVQESERKAFPSLEATAPIHYPGMYGPILSVLLMGMLPMASAPAVDQIALQDLSIAAPLQVPADADELLELQRVTASGVLITDLTSGQTVAGREEDVRRPMGSLTKLMTALLIVENHALTEVVTVPKDIAKVQGHVLRLHPGDRYSVGDMLTVMLLASANDAAESLARFHSGSRTAFVAAMNERATVLGLKDTSFSTPDGMDGLKQWSTPRDLAWLAQFVLRKPEIAQRMGLARAEITPVSGKPIVVEHTHALLREGDSAIVAGKTGTTEAAGQCLLSVVREGRHEYLVVLLGSRERYADMRVLLATLQNLFA